MCASIAGVASVAMEAVVMEAEQMNRAHAPLAAFSCGNGVVGE